MSPKLTVFCLLWSALWGSCQENDGPAQKSPAGDSAPGQFEVVFALKEVHPNSETVVRDVKAGEPAPPGYDLFPMRVFDKENRVTENKEILLSRRTLINQDAILLARATGQPGEVAVKLTKKGGQRLTHATERMKLGKDRMAIVFEDQCLLAPIVHAVLSQDFLITGLSGKAEVDRVVKVLTPKNKK